MDKTILQSEYDKAAKRLVEQREVVRQTQIAADQKDFPSLSATAKRRLPKLKETLAQTESLVQELSKALGYDQVQLDVEDVIKRGSPAPAADKRR